MTAHVSDDLFQLFRERVHANPLLADLADDYLHAITVVRPTTMADELRVIAKDFVELRTNQVHPLWLAWRQSLRDHDEQPAEPPTPAPAEPGRPLSVVPPTADASSSAARAVPPAPVSPGARAATNSTGRGGFPAAPWVAPDRSAFNPDIDLERQGVPLAAVIRRGSGQISWEPTAVPAGSTAVYLVVGGRTPVRGPLQGTALVLTTDRVAPIELAAGPHFAVFAYVGSDLPAATSGRAVRVGTAIAITDVTELRHQVDRGAIRLGWTRPPTATKVRVFRNVDEPVPTDYLLPYQIPSDPESDVVTDTDVRPGETYHYLVVATNVDGISSAGVELELRIEVRPRPVTDLQVTQRIEHGVTVVDLSWAPPPDGARVWVYAKPTSLLPSMRRDQLTLAELRRLDLGERALGEAVLVDGRMVLDRVPFPEDEARQYYTPVTVAGDAAILGDTVSASQVFKVVNVEIVDRVTWQLVRFDWPEGATFVDIAPADPGGDPTWSNRKRFTRDQYLRNGGGLFGVGESLNVHEHDIVLRGVSQYAGVATAGPETRVAYTGRWVVAYRFAAQRKGPTVLELWSQWPDPSFRSPAVRVRAFHHPHLLPMAPGQRGVVPLGIRRDGGTEQRVIEVPDGVLPGGQIVTIGELDIPATGFVRVFVDPVQSQVPVVTLDPPAPGALTTSRRVVPRLDPGQCRCRACLAVQDRHPQVFECVNRDCPQRSPQAPFRFQVLVPQLPPAAARRGDPPPLPPVVRSHACPACQVDSDREICKVCLTPSRPDWFALEPLPMAMAGAKTTGKSVYAYVAIRQLEQRVARDLGASITAFDADTAARVNTLGELFRGRQVPVSTQGHAGYDPFTVSITRAQDGARQRGIALNDLSGDWVQDRNSCGNYALQLARSGGIVFLVDITQIPEVAAYLRGQLDILDEADMQDPVESLENINVVIRRQLGLRPDQRIEVPLALAVSKLDALHYLVNRMKDGNGPDAALSIRRGYALTRDPYGGDSQTPLYDPSDAWWVHHEVRSLLVSLKVDRLLEKVENNFANHRYFAVSALGHQPPVFGGVKGFAPFRVDEPFRWLLAEQW